MRSPEPCEERRWINRKRGRCCCYDTDQSWTWVPTQGKERIWLALRDIMLCKRENFNNSENDTLILFYLRLWLLLPSAVARGRNRWVGQCLGCRAVFWTQRLCCWRCFCFKLGLWPSPLLSAKERALLEREKLKLRFKRFFSLQSTVEMWNVGNNLPSSLWHIEAFMSYCLEHWLWGIWVLDHTECLRGTCQELQSLHP